MTFEEWMLAIDVLVMENIEMSIYDLPDMPFMEAFRSRKDPGSILQRRSQGSS